MAAQESENRTLQDRLVKEFQLAEISSVDAGNALPAGIHGAVQLTLRRGAGEVGRPASQLSFRGSRLKDILCHREQRHVSDQPVLSYDRK